MSKKTRRFRQGQTTKAGSDVMKYLVELALHSDDGVELARLQWEADKRMLVMTIYATIIALNKRCCTCDCLLSDDPKQTTLDFLEHGLQLIGMHQSVSLFKSDVRLFLENFRCERTWQAEVARAFELIRDQSADLIHR